MPSRIAIQLARLATFVLRFGSRSFRDDYGPTVAADIAALLTHERQRSGRFAMARLWWSALIDLIGALRRDRATFKSGRLGALSDLRGDFTYAVRSFRRAPAFTAAVVLMLTLGVGMAAAIFAFADGYLFRPLPFPDSDRLFFVRDPDGAIVQTLRATETIALRATPAGRFGFVEWGGRTNVPDLGAIELGGRQVAVRVQGVSAGFAEVLQLPFAAGRAFTRAEHSAVSPVPVWLSYRFWQREMGGDRAVLGRTFSIAGPLRKVDAVVVGVMAQQVTAFDLNNPPPELVAPTLEPDPRTLGKNSLSFPIIRVPADVSVQQAETVIASALQAVAPAPAGAVRRVRLRSLYEYQVYGGRPTAQVFAAGLLLVILLVTINLTHLLLTRGVTRAPEVAARTALGASRWRIARLFLVESLALGAIGVAGGLLVGAWLTSLIAEAIPTFPTAARNLSLVTMAFDARVVTFAVMLGIATAVAAGTWPAWRAIRRPLVLASRGDAVRTHVPVRLARGILASQTAVATVILVGAAFISLGIWRYLNQPLGFEIEDRMSIDLGASSSDPMRPWSASERLAVVDAIRQIPGVRAVSESETQGVQVEPVGGMARDRLRAVLVPPGYFDAWGIVPLAGRLFTGDDFRGREAAVVDETFARAAWPAESAVGKTIRLSDGELRTVIGVIAPMRRRLSAEPAATAYLPATSIEGSSRMLALTAWVPAATPRDLTDRVTSALSTAFPKLLVQIHPITFDSLFVRDAGEATFQRPVVVLFGVATFVLAGIGLFGVVAYLAEQRRREFGIRLALGATSRHVWGEVVRLGVVPAIIGLATGLTAASLLESVVQSTVFGWRSSGPVAMAVVAAALLVVASIASIGPARRAIRIDPVAVLRSE